jgi:thiamine kinase-like enzyme
MRTDNQFKKDKYETSLDDLLESSFADNSIEIANGRISREWVRNSIGCSQNWPNQNEQAKKKIAEYESKLRATGSNLNPAPRGKGNSKDVKELIKRVSFLEQKNSQLREENSYYRRKLIENGWLDSDEENAVFGRLPW